MPLAFGVAVGLRRGTRGFPLGAAEGVPLAFSLGAGSALVAAAVSGAEASAADVSTLAVALGGDGGVVAAVFSADATMGGALDAATDGAGARPNITYATTSPLITTNVPIAAMATVRAVESGAAVFENAFAELSPRAGGGREATLGAREVDDAACAPAGGTLEPASKAATPPEGVPGGGGMDPPAELGSVGGDWLCPGPGGPGGCDACTLRRCAAARSGKRGAMGSVVAPG